MVDWYYPIQNITGSENILDYFSYGNEITGGMFGILVLIPIWMVLFLTMIRFGMGRAFVGASFSTSLLSYLMAVMGLININIVLIPTLATAVGIIFIGRGVR